MVDSLPAVFGCCILILYLFYFYAQMMAKDPSAHMPEDAGILKGMETGTDEKAKRMRRIWINEQENVPLAVGILTACYVLVRGSDQEDHLAGCIIAYTVLRRIWFFAYLFAINSPVPVRSLCFVASQLSLIACFVIALIAAFD